MAVQLPDFTAVGVSEPTAGNVIPNYPNEDPTAAAQARIGTALGTFGTGLERAGTAAGLLGGQLNHQANVADAALAAAKLQTDTERTLAAIKAENDPAKVDALYNQLPGHLQNAGQLIQDPGYRALWSARHAPEVTKAQLGAELRQRQIYNDNYLAGRNQQVDDTTRLMAQSDDLAVRQEAQARLANIYSSAVEAGVISQTQAQAAGRVALEKGLVSRAQYLDSQGRTPEALAFVRANLANFSDPRQADALINTLRPRAEQLRGKALGRGIQTGMPSNLGQAGLEADFAKRSGIFGTPEEAGRQLTTVTAPGGASFQVHDMAAPQISGFLNDLAATGYKIDPANSGGYNNRNKVGVNTDEKSEHAYGTAIDINTDKNKQSDQLITDLPPNVAQLATKWGLKWGGTFSGKKDAMHFEVARLLPGGQPSQDIAVLPANMAKPGSATADDPRGMEPVIRSAAQANGVDPNVAMRVARAEGLTDRLGDGGTSGGAFQLHIGGGLGDEFQQQTGLDPLDPKNEPATIYWAMQNLGRTGWTPYRGAAAAGVGPTQGIAGGPDQMMAAAGQPPVQLAGAPGPPVQVPGAGAPRPGPRPSLEDQLNTIDQAPGYNENEKEIAKAEAVRIDNQHRAAIRGEISNVAQLRKDDVLSMAQTGQGVSTLTYDRVAAAMGKDEADEWQQDHNIAQDFYAVTGDFDKLPTFEINRRLENLQTGKAGLPGFEKRQRWFAAAEKKAKDIEQLRLESPADAVARFPDVMAASQGADLNQPSTMRPLVDARVRAMISIDQPLDNQIPITKEEATTLYRPIQEALRLHPGDDKLLRETLRGTITKIEQGWGGYTPAALAMVMGVGHASEQTKETLHNVLRKLASDQSPTPQEGRVLDQSAITGASGSAVAGAAPPSPATSRSYPVPDAGAITLLRQNPQDAPAFDATYGPGKAESVLGATPAVQPPAPPMPTPPSSPAPARVFPAPDAAAIDALRRRPQTAAGFDATYGPGMAERVLGGKGP